MMMDRLPLVQALTQAGLERTGAEHVATAIGDAIEASVATKGDIARLEAATKADISRLEAATRADFGAVRAEISRLEVSIRGDMHALETRLTLRLGGIVVAAIGLLFAVLRFAGHTP